MDAGPANGTPAFDPAALQKFAENTLRTASIAQAAIPETAARIDPASAFPRSIFLPASPIDWKASAQEQAGSWWPVWANWLHERSGSWVSARDPASGALAPIDDAPGSYLNDLS